MNIRLAALGAISSCLVFATAVRAEEAKAGADEVTLKDGGTVRGTVTAVQPGKVVQIIEGGSQEIRVFPWVEVASVAKAKYAVTTKPAAPPAKDAAPAPKDADKDPSKAADDAQPAKAQPEGMKVHIDSPVHADLFRLRTHVSTIGVVAPVYGYYGYGYGVGYVGTATVASTSEEAVCSAPCDKVVPADPGDQFVIRGDFPATKKFVLTGDHPSVALSPGSNPRKWGGVAMAAGGGASMIGGIIALPIGAATTVSIDSSGMSTTHQNTNALAVGGTMLGVGAGLVAGGIALAVTSRSGVDIGPGGTDRSATTALSIAPWIGAPPAPAPKEPGRASSAALVTDNVFGVRGTF